MTDEINTTDMEWFVYTANSTEAQIITTSMRQKNLDTETQCIEIPSGINCNIFRVDNHLANLIITNSDLKEYQLYAKEKIAKSAFPVGRQSAKILLGLTNSDDIRKDPLTFRQLVEIVERARYMHQGKKLFELTVYMEESAKRKGFRTFKVYDLVEKYEKGNLKLSDLIGTDKVVYDYLCQKSYVFAIKKRNGKHHLRAISWPKVHTRHKLCFPKTPA